MEDLYLKQKEMYRQNKPYAYLMWQVKAVQMHLAKKTNSFDLDSYYLIFNKIIAGCLSHQEYKTVNFDDNFANLLSNTESHVEECNMVYPHFVLNTPFEENGMYLHGLGFTQNEGTNWLFGVGILKGETEEEFLYFNMDEPNKNDLSTKGRVFCNFMLKIYKNFCTFMSEYKIQYKTVEYVRTDEDMRKREKRGKPVIAKNETKIILSDELKRYYSQFEYNRANSKLSLVRGHWRVFTSERYTEKRHTKIWILPYLKGAGDSINHQTYVLRKEQ